MSVVFAMSATSSVYLRPRKGCGSAANRRWGSTTVMLIARPRCPQCLTATASALWPESLR